MFGTRIRILALSSYALAMPCPVPTYGMPVPALTAYPVCPGTLLRVPAYEPASPAQKRRDRRLVSGVCGVSAREGYAHTERGTGLPREKHGALHDGSHVF
eukprot:96618-Rhodomonas_salina.2